MNVTTAKRDVAYERARNALIRKAERAAAEASGPRPRGVGFDDWAVTWNRAFHQAMARLAREAGLVTEGS